VSGPAVLDASALLALFGSEPGAEAVAALLDGAVMSSVNWSEVIQITQAAGLPTEDRRIQVEALGVTLISFSPLQAEIAAGLASITAPTGLSLADRACLATALDLGGEPITADRAWGDVDVGLSVNLIR